ncbi:MAG: hypothetical protein HAW62_04250 [Endozoicomonadaceae bacterium]|nr:hypothetical protein [Endozoicomonadaceae bacterium]
MCFFIQTIHKLLHFLNYFNKKDHIRRLCCLIAKVSNGLSRQYLPKKTKFIGIENDEILAIQKALNNRPRKVLNYRTPNEVIRGIEKPYRCCTSWLNGPIKQR